MAIHFEQTVEENGPFCVVCGAPIRDIRRAFMESHRDLLFAFCRQECLEDFLKDPERYAAVSPADG